MAIFYDTDCLSCFIMVNQTWILEQLYDKIIIPKQVYNEFKRPKNNKRIQKIKQLEKKGFLIIKSFEINTKEHYTYKQIRDGDITGRDIGPGESAALTLAIHNNGIIASNNTKDVIEIVKLYKLQWIKTGDILKKAIEKEIITLDKEMKYGKTC